MNQRGRWPVRWWAMVGVAAALAGAMPLLLSGSQLGRDLPAVRDGADPLAQCAQLGQALRHAPWDPQLLHAPWFWPTPFAQTFLDPLIAPSIVARLLPGASNRPALAYQFVMWFSLATAMGAATVLGRRWGLSRCAALAAGLVYALGPMGSWHWHHLNQLHGPFLPLALVATDELLRGRRPQWALLGLGMLLIVQLHWSVYGCASSLLAIGGFGIARGWSERVRARWVALACVAVTAVLLWGSQPFRTASELVEGFGREPEQTVYFQARIGDFLRAPAPHLLAWPPSEATRAALYPGLVWTALAAWGLRSAWRGRNRALLALTAASALAVVASFGRSVGLPGTGLEIPLPFAWLQDQFWPLQAIRVPARFVVITALGLALVGSFGAQAIWRAVSMQRRAVRALAIAVFVLAALDLAPGPLGKVRAALDADERAVVAMLATLPDGMAWVGFPMPCSEAEESSIDARWMLLALASARPVAGGASGFVPPATAALRSLCCASCCEGVQDECVRALRSAGIGWIVAPRGSLRARSAAAQEEPIHVLWRGDRHEIASLVRDPPASAPLPPEDSER